MIRNIIIICAAVLVCALPFALRPAPDVGAWHEGDPVLVAVSPHIAAIRDEFANGFSHWHLKKYGTPVRIDWRSIGGTTEIMRYLNGEYAASYRAYRRRQGLDPGLANAALSKNRPEDSEAAAAWDDFRAHDDPDAYGCKIDIFFGGGTYDHGSAERQGITVAPWTAGNWPKGILEDDNGIEMIPRELGGEIWRTDVYVSAVLSGFGICSNPDRLRELGIEKMPSTWKDLTDPRLYGFVGVTDPTKSGSIAKAFEMILHATCREHVLAAGWTPEQIQTFETAAKKGLQNDLPDFPRYQADVEAGWLSGIHLLQRVGANSRYFTDAAGKVPVDVSSGDAAAGICIDFYGRVQAETTRVGNQDRLNYVTPHGGSTISGDPISLLRGAEHRELAQHFIEFVLCEDGQKLWNGRPGSDGGPQKHALRRLPVRRDFYPDDQNPTVDARARARKGTTSDNLLDPTVDAYTLANAFTYEPRWTAAHFSFLRSFVRAMCMDAGRELRSAWKAILEAGGPEAVPEAVALLERMPVEPYPIDWATVTEASRNRSMTKGLSETDLTSAWTSFFRNSYREAEACARKLAAEQKKPATAP